jgi:hypothetical protein
MKEDSLQEDARPNRATDRAQKPQPGDRHRTSDKVTVHSPHWGELLCPGGVE